MYSLSDRTSLVSDRAGGGYLWIDRSAFGQPVAPLREGGAFGDHSELVQQIVRERHSFASGAGLEFAVKIVGDATNLDRFGHGLGYQVRQKAKNPRGFPRRFFIIPGAVLLSHPRQGAVPSAMEGLASVFGMGTGVSPPPYVPEFLEAEKNVSAFASSCSTGILPVRHGRLAHATLEA